MKAIILFLLIFPSLILHAQRVYVEGNKLLVDGSPIYMNGANTPWDKWNDFGGDYDSTFWESEFQRFEEYGLNSTRIWISCNGVVAPTISEEGMVTGVSEAFWKHCDDLMARAQKHKIYVMASMMSFDNTKDSHEGYKAYRAMFQDQKKIQSFVDLFLIPFVNRYKDNPYLFNIDLCNEIEWMNQNEECGNIAWQQLQLYAAMASSAIHRSESKVTVSIGTAAIKWGSDVHKNAAGNFWSDSSLQAQFNDSLAFLDIYQLHYYSWINEWLGNPFELGPVAYGINDKPVLIGEMPGRHTLMGIEISMLECFENAFSLGYQGHYPWTSNNAGVGDFGSLSTFGDASTSFMKSHTKLVYPDR